MDGRCNFANLVEKDRAGAGDFKQTCLVSDRTRKGAPYVAKQFGLEQRFGERRAVDAHKRRRGARALVVDQPDNELLARPTLTVNQNGRLQRSDARGQFEDVLHRPAAGDKVLRRRMTIHPFSQQVQFTLATLQQTFAAVQLLEPFADRLVQALDFVSHRGRLKIGTDCLQISPPTLCVAADCHAMLGTLSRARRLTKIHFLPQARADEPAGVPD